MLEEVEFEGGIQGMSKLGLNKEGRVSTGKYESILRMSYTKCKIDLVNCITPIRSNSLPCGYCSAILFFVRLHRDSSQRLSAPRNLATACVKLALLINQHFTTEKDKLVAGRRRCRGTGW